MRTEHGAQSFDGKIDIVSYIVDNLGLDGAWVLEMLKQVGLNPLIPFSIRYNGGLSGAGPDDYDDCQILNESELKSLETKASMLKNSSEDEEDKNVFEAYEFACNTIRYINDDSDLEEFRDGEYSEYFKDESYDDGSWDGPNPDDAYESQRDSLAESEMEGPSGYDVWIGHSDLPYSSDGRFFNIVFFDNNGNIEYAVKGDSNGNKDIEVKPGSLFDKEIRNYISSHVEEIKNNILR